MYAKLLTLLLIAAAATVALGLLYRTSESITGSRVLQYATTTFAVEYPYGYTLDEGYVRDVAPGRLSTGVKFMVPKSLTEGTNLSPDTYVSVEWLPTMVACSAVPYLADPVIAPTFHEGERTYSVALASEGAMGSRFEETVYAALGQKGCMAVRYYIHSMNIGNYDPGTVRKFDKDALLRQFDGVRRSLTLL